MKTKNKVVIGLLAIGASAWVIIAQDNGGSAPDQRPPRRQNSDAPGGPGGPGGPRMHGNRPPLPAVIRALDANHDGVVDAEEIANAPAALKTLDKNGDGKLTMDELMGPPPQGGGRPPGNGPGDGPGNFDGPPGPPPGDQ